MFKAGSKYGCLTVERWMEDKLLGTFLRVLLDGEDVTFRCFEADDTVGRVLMMCRDKEHKDWRVENTGLHSTPGSHDGLHRLEVFGDVNIVPEPVESDEMRTA